MVRHIHFSATPSIPSDISCAICQDPLVSNEKAPIEEDMHPRQLSGCGHSFHHKCIAAYISRRNDRCPLCREVVRSRTNRAPRYRTRRSEKMQRTQVLDAEHVSVSVESRSPSPEGGGYDDMGGDEATDSRRDSRSVSRAESYEFHHGIAHEVDDFLRYNFGDARAGRNRRDDDDDAEANENEEEEEEEEDPFANLTGPQLDRYIRAQGDLAHAYFRLGESHLLMAGDFARQIHEVHENINEARESGIARNLRMRQGGTGTSVAPTEVDITNIEGDQIGYLPYPGVPRGRGRVDEQPDVVGEAEVRTADNRVMLAYDSDIYGNHNLLQGNRSRVFGNHNFVVGDNCQAFGHSNFLVGSGCSAEGRDNTILERPQAGGYPEP